MIITSFNSRFLVLEIERIIGVDVQRYGRFVVVGGGRASVVSVRIAESHDEHNDERRQDECRADANQRAQHRCQL